MAVVAAILTSGLRIMPHSGGRVGKGIYFASENSKSASYGELIPRGQDPSQHGTRGGTSTYATHSGSRRGIFGLTRVLSGASWGPGAGQGGGTQRKCSCTETGQMPGQHARHRWGVRRGGERGGLEIKELGGNTKPGGLQQVRTSAHSLTIKI